MFVKHDVTVTPTDAREWLDTKNSRNRPVSQFVVDKYVQQIKTGRWKANGQGIIFGKSGQLLDGQHRLKAVVQAGKPIQTMVVYGVEDDAFDTIDDVHGRTLADVFAIRGEANSQIVAAAVRFVWEYATGQIVSRKASRATIATKQLLEKMLDNHPRVRQSARFVCMLKSRPGGIMVGVGLAAGLHYLFALIDEKKADEFMTQFQSGLNLSEGHPVALLRQRLIAARSEKSTKLSPEAVYAYVVLAWNAFVKDQPLKRMAFVGEALPEIADLPKSLMRDLI